MSAQTIRLHSMKNIQIALQQDVEALALPQGRVTGSQGHAKARDFLITRMEELGLRPYSGDDFELPYTAEGEDFVNVVGVLPGKDPALPPLLLAAHYDTCGPQPGADDNAAAMAILLACVEPLREAGIARSIVFAFFDAEEPPHYLSPSMGSVHFYHSQRVGPVHCAIVLDLVGHDVPIPGLEDLLFITGMESDAGLETTLRSVQPPEGLRVIPTLNRYIGDLSDHHVFRMRRRPYLFLSCGHWPHYHQTTDTPERLNYGKMASIQGFVADIAKDAAQRSLEGPFEGYDSTPAEVFFLNSAAGPFLSSFGFEVNSREDIDMISQLMIHQFGL